MIQDEFDKMVREAIPPVVISDERVNRLIAGSLQAASQRQRRFEWRFPAFAAMAPLMQYALPIFVAIALGISVGEDYANDWPLAQFNALMLSTPLYAGS